MEYIVKYPEGQSIVDTPEEALQVVKNLLDSAQIAITDIHVWEARRFKIDVCLIAEN